MKKLLALCLSMLLLVTPVLAKVQKYDDIEYWDIDDDDVLDAVYVKITEKHNKRNDSLKKVYFDEYWEYLGEELWVNGELFEDTFPYNN